MLTIHDAAHAVPLAEALFAGGLNVLEITLRTAVAIAAVSAIRRQMPGRRRVVCHHGAGFRRAGDCNLTRQVQPGIEKDTILLRSQTE